ncbi:hypothetical protein ACVWXN_009449 [Bradyrhizobium sp. i1.4.4]
MRDDLVEVIAAMVERRRQILPEEPVDETCAAHQWQRRAHQAPRALEDQHREQGADREIEPGRIAVARNQVGIEDPLIEAAEEAGAADHPAERATDIALRGEIGDQAEGEENEEADMDAAHHLARQIVEGGDIELEGGEGDADPVGELAPPARTKTFRKTVLEIVEFNLDGLCGALCLQHARIPAPIICGAYNIELPLATPSWPGLSRPSTAHGASKNVDGRDICAKTRFALLPGHDVR